MKRNTHQLTRCAIASLTLVSLAISANAAVHKVDCDADGKIAPVLASAKAGDTVTVSGICKESVLFTPAIHLSGPATAVIDNNVIRQSGGAIHLDKGSIGTIFDNRIEDNRGYGINLIENSYARIGFRIPTLAKPQPNVIQNNDGPGIIVGRWSSAWVVGNQLTNNKGHGVIVDRQSQADVQANDISGNGGDGIRVSHGSAVNFDSVGSDMVINEPNRSKTVNAGAGVRCDVGGYISGRLGSLNGKTGSHQTAKGCVDNTTP